MINCIAVDDEPLALNLLADNISKIPFLHLVCTCSDAFKAAEALQQNDIELVFIDIQMPGITGLQFIASLVKKPMVILITAYKQYALDGFAMDVVDYLVKPVPMDRFMKACNKAKELFELRSKSTSRGDKPAEYTFVNVGYSMQKIVFEDITYIEGLKDYAQIHLRSLPKPAIVRISFKILEDQLPPYFSRIHKSFIVNTKNITAVNRHTIYIGDKELPLGSAYKQGIDDMIAQNRF
ncbi:LytR/AlgR family response regulator transcription factor [Mucilaginibacter paludis]|uniref:Two component transcriptional regulator, LytTR family n=1 Tax=Mucilaginibacter paludis DSM 18603 TaxID=714943 RepID=H1Y5V6_9SPHI|nr:response regulator transcription factor [Mucilaginibacter paludis]EHQ30378.1 two component transcriptional regulator, LytTR family [Mucilaginibacter paludis DSM 18603]